MYAGKSSSAKGLKLRLSIVMILAALIELLWGVAAAKRKPLEACAALHFRRMTCAETLDIC